MTGRERCEEIMRLIDEALESVPAATEGRWIRPSGPESGSRSTGPPAGRPRR